MLLFRTAVICNTCNLEAAASCFGRWAKLVSTAGDTAVSDVLHAICEDSGAVAACILGRGEAEKPLWEYSAQPWNSAIISSVLQEAFDSGEIALQGSCAVLPTNAEYAAVLSWSTPPVCDEIFSALLRSASALLRIALPSALRVQELEKERDRVVAILLALPQGVVFESQSGAKEWSANPEAARLFGLGPAPSQAAIKDAMDCMQQDAVADPGNSGRQVWALPGESRRVISVTRRDVGDSTAQKSLAQGRLWVFSELTEQHRAQDELRASEDRYRELFDNSPLPAWVYDTATLAIMTVNRAATAHYGYSREEFLTKTLRDLRPPEEVSKLLSSLTGMQKTQQRSGPWIHRKKDGALLLVEVSSHEVSFAGRLARLVMVNDVTERSTSEQRFRDQEERWQLALRGNNDGLWDYDITNHKVYYSRRWKEMLGYEDCELPNIPEEWERLVHPDDLPGVHAKLSDHLSRRALFYVAEYRMRCRDGSYKWVLARGQVIWKDGNAVRMVGSHTDITERKDSEAQLTRDALYDSLTGLLNRRYLLEELDRAVMHADHHNQPLSLALGDLDHFKSVNDTYGHAAGDEVLSVFGQLMQKGQRQGDAIGRIGGDEFCIVFPRANVNEALIEVENVRVRLSTMAFGVSSGVPFPVNATFGLAAWQPGMTGKELLEAADRALYQAKECGRNRLATV